MHNLKPSLTPKIGINFGLKITNHQHNIALLLSNN